MDDIVLRVRIKGRKHPGIYKKKGLISANKVNAGLGSIVPYVGWLVNKLFHVVVNQKLAKDLTFPCSSISLPKKWGSCVEVT